MNSTHKAEVVKIELKNHPEANNLSIVHIYGYCVVVRTDDWKDKNIGVYICPDSLVDTTRPEFSFLKTGNRTQERIKVKRLRGVLSMGLLVPAPEGSNIGDDVAEILGVGHYEPPTKTTKGEAVGGPSLFVPKYDIDSYYRYLDCFNEGELVYITEKIHGANGRFVYDGKMYCGSRTEWKKEEENNLWWRALKNTPALEEYCRQNPKHIVYGEVYGQVQNLKYDLNDVAFRAFDILIGDKWLDAPDFILHSCFGLPIVPTLKFEWPLNKEEVKGLAEGKSEIASHVREGCVVRPMKERYDMKLGRVIAKIVGEGYYNLK